MAISAADTPRACKIIFVVFFFSSFFFLIQTNRFRLRTYIYIYVLNSFGAQWPTGGQIAKTSNAVDDGKAAEQSAPIAVQTVDGLHQEYQVGVVGEFWSLVNGCAGPLLRGINL